ncbi:MAG: OmpH family outer membrane protein [candidate division WS1 bacterium]|nr:OmpH family outer membrane protein [candidate division WS1 bacterium]
MKNMMRILVSLALVAMLSAIAGNSALAQGAGKIAVVDMGKLTDNYTALQDRQQALTEWLNAKQEYVQTLQDYMFLSTDNFNEVIELLKTEKLPADRQKRVDELRNLAGEKERQFLDLRSKTNRSAQEDDAYKALGDSFNASQQRVAVLHGDLQQEYNQQVTEARQQFMNIVQETARAVATQEGYEVVLDSSIVLVGGADITDKILERLNPAPAAAPAEGGGG